LNPITNTKDKILDKYRSKIRERAITRAKARIALSDKKLSDFTEDELEVIVQDEEEQVRNTLKQSGVVALLLVLGLS
jgi:hypothetical protein